MDTLGREWASARILRYDRRPPGGDSRVCLLWPAWAYRVTSPVLERRGLDLFERVTLALCQAGIRQPDRISELVGLKTPLCAHILDRAINSGHLDSRYDVTAQGREALRSGSSATTAEWQVCYVFEDPFTGDLWPRTVDQLREAHVLRADAASAELELGTAGRSDRAVARRVHPPGRRPQRPSAARVVEAASADRTARRVHQVRRYEQEVGLAPAAVPDGLGGVRGAGPLPEQYPELDRVAFLAEPTPVYLAGFLRISGDDESDTAEAWAANDPFGLGTGDVFQSLVYRFGRAEGSLDEEINTRVLAQLTVARDRYQQADQELRAALERQLAHEFGPAVRGNRNAFDLMLEVDLAIQLANRDEAIERAAHTALRLYEVLFSQMLVAYPLRRDQFDSFLHSRPLRRAMLEQSAQGLGFQHVTALYANVRDDELTRTFDDPSHGFVKAMFPLALLAAPNHDDHPLRRMAAEQPDLPVTLTTLNALRNRAAHAGRDAANPYDTGWCREAAASATRALLSLPDPRAERTHL